MIFRIRRTRDDCWVLHCYKCGTNEENKHWTDAVRAMPIQPSVVARHAGADSSMEGTYPLGFDPKATSG